MADRKLITFVKKLSQRTLEGKVPWEKTVEDAVFQAAFPAYSITIGTRETQNEFESGVDYVIKIFNDEGGLVEVIADPDFAKGDFDGGAFRVMEEIYAVARRTAMGVEKALDSLLASLNETSSKGKGSVQDDDIPF
jgi:hypothetical protein